MPNILLGFLGGILILRLIIWQFFRNTEVFFREEFSDITVASLIVFSGILWLVFKFFKRQSFKKSGFDLPIFLLMAAAAVSLFHAPDLSSSLKGVLVLGAEITFFYMLLDLLDTPARLRLALIFLSGMALITSIYGIVTFFAFSLRPSEQGDLALVDTNRSLYYLLVHHRAVSFLGWPNILAGFLLLFLPLLIVLSFYLKKIGSKAAAVACLFLAAVCFLYTFSFLSWLSFIFSMVIFLPFIWKYLDVAAWTKEKKRMLVYGYSAFIVLFLLVIFHKNFLVSLAPRVFYYKAAFTLLGQNPVLGYGWDSFGILCRLLTHDTNDLSAYIHNSYLQIWLETGIIGFLGIVLLVRRVYLQARKSILSQRPVDWVFVGVVWGLTAFLIDNLFSFTMLKPNVALYWWTMLAVFCAMLRMNRHSERSEGSHPGGDSSPFGLRMMILCILLLMFIVSARIMGGYMLYYKAMCIKRPGSYDASFQMLDKAKVLDPWSSYLPVGAANIHMEEYGNTRLKNFLKLASMDYLEAIRRSPRVYYNYFALGKIYEALGDIGRGQAFTQRARELSPAQFELDTRMFMASSR